MVGRSFAILLASLAGTAFAAPLPEAQDIGIESVERTGLLPTDIALLENPGIQWKHLQTEHFVLHHDQKMFAAKVAHMGEQFYDAISADLPSLQDRTAPARSHIFIFRDPQAWQASVGKSPGLDAWASSFVRGNAMYLQETGTATSGKMDTLAHEMTHLVFNRYLAIRLPLWLNEGLAEYYGEFAYRAARGMGQGKNNAFPPLRKWMPLADLLNATAYPADPAEAGLFYTTSKYLTGFLRLKLPQEKWDAFFARLRAGEPDLPTLLGTYGWADIAALEKAFLQFAR